MHVSCIPNFPFIVFCQHKWTKHKKTCITVRIKCRGLCLSHAFTLISLHHRLFVTVRASIVNLAVCQLEVAGKLGCYGWEALVHLHTLTHTHTPLRWQMSDFQRVVKLSVSPLYVLVRFIPSHRLSNRALPWRLTHSHKNDTYTHSIFHCLLQYFCFFYLVC